MLGGALGVAGGYFFAKLGLMAMPWAVFGGACAGVLAVLAVLGIHREIRTRTRTRRRP
jgi:membrane associated rhomboid family serine protease